VDYEEKRSEEPLGRPKLLLPGLRSHVLMCLRQSVILVGLRLVAPYQCLAVLMEVRLRGLVADPRHAVLLGHLLVASDLGPGRRRAVHTHRYAKQVPGHHVQVDVKFLTLQGEQGQRIRRYQYTAIDDATRVRALKVYRRHTQRNAIAFVDYVVQKFLFRIHTVRTDRGHEFQALFHWHLADQGIQHAYIKPRTPQLNGKVERSHRTDQQEFYQLLSYTGDADLVS
jgi:transposase InsO family protein